MVNEQDVRSYVESVLKKMLEEQSSQVETVKTSSQHTESNSMDAGESLPDLTETDIKKDLLVPEPFNKDGYLKMKEATPARIGVWRAGARYKTSTSLRFRADHAAAQDAVFSYVSDDLIEKLGLLEVETLCSDKDQYLTRPDLGRAFSKEMIEKIKKTAGQKVQLVIGDGLSSAAIEANAKEILPSIKQGLKIFGIDTNHVLFVKHCRVPAMDVIGEVTDADVVCLLVGERPGLVTAESMSAYIAYKPTVDMPEARRTVVSNIHSGGTSPVEAGAHIAEIIKNIIDNKASGIDLKL